MQLQVREFNIGIRTKQTILNWSEECASDRIRARMIAESLPENIELYRNDTNYFNVIYHNIDRKIYGTFLNILDVCDYALIIENGFEDFAKKMDCIVCATQALSDAIKLDIPKIVIGDGHDVQKRLKKWHIEKAKKAVWFGYSGNFKCMEPFMPVLKKNNIELRIISEYNDKRGEFIKWELETSDKYINECDFAILPFNNKYKTNNKDVTAWLNGLPVAKTEEDIIRFINPFERNKYLSKIDYKEFNIFNRAKDYYNLCAEYSDIKNKEKIHKSD